MRLLAWVVVLGLCACARGEPPTFLAFDGGAYASASVAPIPPGPEDASVDASVDAGPAIEQDAGGLPQTHDRPSPDGALLLARAEGLFDAIVKDDPDLALPFFFPAGAYAQVKAIANPASDFKHRLLANYKRDIHAAHEKLGAAASRAKFVGLSVPMDRARWVEPGEEGNKLGYFRVYGSKLEYEDQASPGARKLTIELTSLISWRGEWYVVHLTGFK